MLTERALQIFDKLIECNKMLGYVQNASPSFGGVRTKRKELYKGSYRLLQ